MPQFHSSNLESQVCFDPWNNHEQHVRKMLQGLLSPISMLPWVYMCKYIQNKTDHYFGILFLKIGCVIFFNVIWHDPLVYLKLVYESNFCCQDNVYILKLSSVLKGALRVDFIYFFVFISWKYYDTFINHFIHSLLFCMNYMPFMGNLLYVFLYFVHIRNKIN